MAKPNLSHACNTYDNDFQFLTMIFLFNFFPSQNTIKNNLKNKTKRNEIFPHFKIEKEIRKGYPVDWRIVVEKERMGLTRNLE